MRALRSGLLRAGCGGYGSAPVLECLSHLPDIAMSRDDLFGQGDRVAAADLGPDAARVEVGVGDLGGEQFIRSSLGGYPRLRPGDEAKIPWERGRESRFAGRAGRRAPKCM
ncbi:hypothetical protein DMH25_42675 [Streptomyces sp. WAC 01325]|nr:hypothetical protein DMH25_42675 [Streptomyces sp. WAC 01325]